MLKIRCRGCGALLKVSTPADDKKSIRCPKCEETVPLPKRGPSAEDSVESEPATLRIARFDQPRRPKRSSSRSANPALSFIAGAIAFVVCGGLAYTFVSGLTRPSDPAEVLAPRATSTAEPSPQASPPAPATITVSLDPAAVPAVATAEDTEDAPPPGKITARSFIPAGRDWLLALRVSPQTKAPLLGRLLAVGAHLDSSRMIPLRHCEISYFLLDHELLVYASVTRVPLVDEKIAERVKGLQKQEYGGTTIYMERWGLAPMYLIIVDKQIVVFNSDLNLLKQTIDQSLEGKYGATGLSENSVFAIKVKSLPDLNRPYRHFLFDLQDGPNGVTNRQGERIDNPPAVNIPPWAAEATNATLTVRDDNGLSILGVLGAKDQIAADTMAAFLRVRRDVFKGAMAGARKNLGATKEQNDVIDRLLATDVKVGAKNVSLAVQIDEASQLRLVELFTNSHFKQTLATLFRPTEPSVATAREPEKPPRIPPLAVVRPTFKLVGKDVTAGSAFAVQWPGDKRPILLTALSLFGPAGGLDIALSSEDLPSRVNGVTLHDLRSNKEVGTGGKALPLTEGYAWAIGKTAAGDLAAFYLPANSRLEALPLAKEIAQPGKLHWLVCQESDEPGSPQRLVLAYVHRSSTDSLEYVLESALNVRSAIGAPLVNAAGEVVGIHVGMVSRDATVGNANPMPSIRKRLDAALKNK